MRQRGFFNHLNFSSYGYCYQNPVIFIDPDGKQVISGYVVHNDGERLAGIGFSFDVESNILQIGVPSATLVINVDTKSFTLLSSGESIESAAREMNKNNMYNWVPDTIKDAFVDGIIDFKLMGEIKDQIATGMEGSSFLPEFSKELITNHVLKTIGGLKQDLLDDNAELLISDSPDKYIKKNGKLYQYTDGTNYTAKYIQDSGKTKTYIRYTDWNDKRSVEKRNADKARHASAREEAKSNPMNERPKF